MRVMLKNNAGHIALTGPSTKWCTASAFRRPVATKTTWRPAGSDHRRQRRRRLDRRRIHPQGRRRRQIFSPPRQALSRGPRGLRGVLHRRVAGDRSRDLLDNSAMSPRQTALFMADAVQAYCPKYADLLFS